MKTSSTGEPDYRIGEKVPGTNWVVRGVLGRGGMGVVLDVEKEASGLRMAMKVLRPAFARSDEFTGRFLEEVRLLAALRHPNIVDVTDCDTLADGTPYIMMERLEGRTLRAALSDRDIVFAAENVWNIIGQLSRALHCAHTARPPIVHRDVKPANVFLHDRKHFLSSVKLIDFGISAVVDERRARGAPMGTARYMAPEACRGEAPTPQADIYALGMIVYEMLTRALPWDLENRSAEAWMQAHLALEPIAPSRRTAWIPRSVDECLLRALHKDRTQRQRSVLEFHEQLGELPFVDDGSGNHRHEGVTAPTPETLAHGRAGVLERGTSPAARGPTAVSTSVDGSVAIEGPSHEPSAGDSSRAAPSMSSDVALSSDGREASAHAPHDESVDTPLSSASGASEPAVRLPGRTGRRAVATAFVSLGFGAVALASRWILGNAGRREPPAAASLPAFLDRPDMASVPTRTELAAAPESDARSPSAQPLMTDSGHGAVLDVAKATVGGQPVSGSHPVGPTKKPAGKPNRAPSGPAGLEPSAPQATRPPPLSDEQLLFIPGGKQ